LFSVSSFLLFINIALELNYELLLRGTLLDTINLFLTFIVWGICAWTDSMRLFIKLHLIEKFGSSSNFSSSP
jgi:hypothetical protein